MTLRIKKLQGRKGDTPDILAKDRIIVLECDGCNKQHAMKYPQIAEYLMGFCDVEDNLYPPLLGNEGAGMFIRYVNEAMSTRKLPDRTKYGFKT